MDIDESTKGGAQERGTKTPDGGTRRKMRHARFEGTEAAVKLGMDDARAPERTRTRLRVLLASPPKPHHHTRATRPKHQGTS